MMLNSTIPKPISDLVEKYQLIKEKVENRRRIWHMSVRTLIEEELHNILTHTRQLGWKLSTVGTANFESVILDIGRSCSGIQTNERNATYRQQGGVLSFSQSTSGSVAIVVWFPYIEDLEDIPPPKTLAVVEPGDIKKEVVQLQIEKFLEELIQFELDSEFRIEYKPSMANQGKPRRRTSSKESK